MRILIIKQTSLGDVLHITPFIRAIKKHHPDAAIDVVVDRRAEGLLSHNPHIRRLYVIDVYGREKDAASSPLGVIRALRAYLADVRQIRREHYDVAFDLQGLARSIVFLYAARADAKFAKGRWIGVPHLDVRNEHAIRILLRFLDFINIPHDGTRIDFFLPPEALDRTREALKTRGITLPEHYLIYAPYSRWKTKNIPPEKSIEILRALIDATGLPILLSATADHAQQCGEFASMSRKIISTCGMVDLVQAGVLIQHAHAVVSVDSFTMHAASAFERPLVALFGPTSEERIGPLSPHSIVVRNRAVSCARCYRRRCPKDFACMRNLSVHAITDALGERSTCKHALTHITISVP